MPGDQVLLLPVPALPPWLLELVLCPVATTPSPRLASALNGWVGSGLQIMIGGTLQIDEPSPASAPAVIWPEVIAPTIGVSA